MSTPDSFGPSVRDIEPQRQVNPHQGSEAPARSGWRHCLHIMLVTPRAVTPGRSTGTPRLRGAGGEGGAQSDGVARTQRHEKLCHRHDERVC